MPVSTGSLAINFNIVASLARLAPLVEDLQGALSTNVSSSPWIQTFSGLYTPNNDVTTLFNVPTPLTTQATLLLLVTDQPCVVALFYSTLAAGTQQMATFPVQDKLLLTMPASSSSALAWVDFIGTTPLAQGVFAPPMQQGVPVNWLALIASGALS